jgi:hypothetical protein
MYRAALLKRAGHEVRFLPIRDCLYHCAYCFNVAV